MKFLKCAVMNYIVLQHDFWLQCPKMGCLSLTVLKLMIVMLHGLKDDNYYYDDIGGNSQKLCCVVEERGSEIIHHDHIIL